MSSGTSRAVPEPIGLHICIRWSMFFRRSTEPYCFRSIKSLYNFDSYMMLCDNFPPKNQELPYRLETDINTSFQYLEQSQPTATIER